MRRRPPRQHLSTNHFSPTVGELYLKTRDRLWRGMRDEEESLYRWSVAVDLLGRNLPLVDIRKSTLEDLALTLSRTPTNRGRGYYAPGTINRFLSAVSKALRWAVDEGLLTKMPVIPWQEEEQGRIAYLREEDAPRFIQYMLDRYGERHAIACQVLLVTGLRIGELMSLRPAQIQLRGGNYCLVLNAADTKTKRNRSVPLPASLVEPLRGLLEAGVPHYRSLLRACLLTSRELDLPDPVTPHVLRHTAATLMTQRGVPSLTVANILGHSSLATTRKYDHHAPAMNPLENLVSTNVICVSEITQIETNAGQVRAPALTNVKTPNEKSMTYGRFGVKTGGLVRIRTGVQGFAETEDD